MAVVELPTGELQPGNTAAAACTQCHQLPDLLDMATGACGLFLWDDGSHSTLTDLVW